MRWRWALPLAVLVFLYALLMHAPAAYLYAWFAPPTGAVQVSGIDGTLGQGNIDAISYQNHPVFRHLQWRLQPLSLLLGRIAVQIHGNDGVTDLNGRVAASPGTLRAGPLHFKSDLKSILDKAGYRFLPLDGLIQLHVKRLRMDDQHLSLLEGKLQLQALRWKMGRTLLRLGNYQANVTTDQDGVIHAVIDDVSGALDVSGTAQLKNGDTYQLDLKIRAKPGAPTSLVNMLRSMGRPDAEGYYQIHNRGRLAQL